MRVKGGERRNLLSTQKERTNINGATSAWTKVVQNKEGG